MRCNQVWLCARVRAAKVGYRIKRIAAAFGAGRDGFWLARWLTARDIEAQVISHRASRYRAGTGAPRPIVFTPNCSNALTGALLVSWNGRYQVRLPLPRDVGDTTIASYRHRGRSKPTNHTLDKKSF